jgi:DNA invertase Pin-like site-specific DNA recombinase
MRTSSATNVGADKDSERRQRSAIEAYAKRAGITVVEWFYDPAVSGADPIEARPGFSALLDRIEGNGVRVVLIEDASRFARDLIAQEPRHRCAGVARGEGHHRKRRLPVRYVRPLPRDDARARR